MSAPNFSPITTQQQRKGVSTAKGISGTRKGSLTDANQKPKYQCPGCQELFTKWSPCLAHLREKRHVEANLLDKKLNGGDFRRVQELCATLAFHYRGGSGGRERTDSNSSVDSLSSDSGEEEESFSDKKTNLRKQRNALASAPVPTYKTRSGLKINGTHPSAHFLAASSSAAGRISLRSFKEHIISRIFSFLDIDSANRLFLIMTPAPIVPERTSSPLESRVRIWSVSSDPDSLSVPSSSPPAVSKKNIKQLGRFQ